MKIIYLCLWGIILGMVLTSIVFADHNSGLEGYDPNRGYNEFNCNQLESTATGRQGEWLGHHVGCLVEADKGYVLIMEYRVQELSSRMADELKELIKEYTKNKSIEM